MHECLTPDLGRYLPPDPTKEKRATWALEYDFSKFEDGEYVSDVGIIVEEPNGEVWTNQTMDTACNHPEAVGRFFSLRADEESVDWQDDFHDDICGTLPDYAPKPGLLDKIDASFRKAGLPIKVDRFRHDRMNDHSRGLQEAWIPVLLEDGRRGFFVYGNCD
jgi:hypothetical protein